MTTSALPSRVEAILDKHARKLVGVAVGIAVAGERWTHGRGRIGPDRREAPDADTIFEIGSITKVFTATLLADMALAGLVALDDPAQKYLPEGVELPVRGRPITLADLATHSSGLPRLPKGMLRRALRERDNPYAGYTVEDLHRAVREGRPRRRPGKRARYSNYGYGLLGHLLALRAGKSYDALVRERIVEPLGLRDTSIDVPAAKLPRFAQGHDRRGRPVPHWDLPALPGAGALRSTVTDLLAFLDLQLDEGSSPLAAAARLTHEARARMWRMQVGLGWFHYPVRGRSYEALFHDGGTGGFRTVCGFVPELRVSVVVLSNCARPVDRLGLRIVEALESQ